MKNGAVDRRGHINSEKKLLRIRRAVGFVWRVTAEGGN
jgi:hypothetical protein